MSKIRKVDTNVHGTNISFYEKDNVFHVLPFKNMSSCKIKSKIKLLNQLQIFLSIIKLRKTKKVGTDVQGRIISFYEKDNVFHVLPFKNRA